MKLYLRFGVPVFLALAVLLASCGTGGEDQGEKAGSGNGQTQKVNHAEKHGSGEMPGMKGMDHGSGGTVPGMLMKNGKYSDERFIDALVPHHEGAVEMAALPSRTPSIPR